MPEKLSQFIVNMWKLPESCAKELRMKTPKLDIQLNGDIIHEKLY